MTQTSPRERTPDARPLPYTHIRRTAAAVLASAALALAAAPLALADPAPAAAPAAAPAPALAPSAARDAATAPATLDLLTRFFARDGVTPMKAAAPHMEGATVNVNTLNPAFVAGRAGAPVATWDFAATKAVAANGRTASIWTVRSGSAWRVVNIATGGDETDYVTKGSARPGGTVFREPQIDAWYVLRDGRVLPLDPDAVTSVGKDGVTLAAYQRLVHRRYGDKLPGSAYDQAGKGGGYDVQGAPAVQPARHSASAGAEPGEVPGAVAGAVAAGLAAAAIVGFGVRRARFREVRTTRRD